MTRVTYRPDSPEDTPSMSQSTAPRMEWACRKNHDGPMKVVLWIDCSMVMRYLGPNSNSCKAVDHVEVKR